MASTIYWSSLDASEKYNTFFALVVLFLGAASRNPDIHSDTAIVALKTIGML
jgi:hypothetical protein